MPPFQLIIRLRYGAEGEDNVIRRATAVGAVGLGVRVCRVGWRGVGGLGHPSRIYVRVGWGRRMLDIRGSPLTMNLAQNPHLDETINLSSSSSEDLLEGGEVEVAEVEEEEDGEIQIRDVRTVEEEQEV